MKAKAGSGRTITAEQAARAIVTACMLLGVDPATAFDPVRRKGHGLTGYRARVLAAHGVRARLGLPPVVLARVFGVPGPELAPSWAKRYGFTSDQLLAISEALGPIEADDARGRFMEPHSGVPVRGRPAASARPPAGAVEGLLHDRPRVVRYAAWFLEADWPLATVARLFDVEPRTLLDALDPEAPR